MFSAKQKLDEAAFRQMWLSGMEVWRMAVKLGMSSTHVGTTAKRLGLPRRWPGGAREPQHDAAPGSDEDVASLDAGLRLAPEIQARADEVFRRHLEEKRRLA
jgi:hypothetical protein